MPAVGLVIVFAPNGKFPRYRPFFPTIPMKLKSGKNHSQSREQRNSAQDVENDFHDHAFSFGREPGIPKGEIGGRLKGTRIHMASSVFFDCFGIFSLDWLFDLRFNLPALSRRPEWARRREATTSGMLSFYHGSVMRQYLL